MKKPKPKSIDIVCDTCGLSWDAHGESPSVLDCIRLLQQRWADHSCIQTSWTFPAGGDGTGDYWPRLYPIISETVTDSYENVCVKETA